MAEIGRRRCLLLHGWSHLSLFSFCHFQSSHRHRSRPPGPPSQVVGSLAHSQMNLSADQRSAWCLDWFAGPPDWPRTDLKAEMGVSHT